MVLMSSGVSDKNADTTVLEQTQLALTYRKLPPVEQKIVQLFSVIYEPINRNSLIACLNQINTLDTLNKPIALKNLNRYIEKLLAAGMLVQSSGQKVQCHPLLTEIATRSAIVAGNLSILIKGISSTFPIHVTHNSRRYFHSESELIREVRIGIYYRQDLNYINEQISDYNKSNERYIYGKEKLTLEKILSQVCNNPFNEEWFATLPQELYEKGISSILQNGFLKCTPTQEAFAQLLKRCSASKEDSCNLQLILVEQLLLRGDIQQAKQILESISDEYFEQTAVFWGWLSFLTDKNQQAIEYYTVGLKALKKALSKRTAYFNSLEGLFFILALLKSGSRENLSLVEEYISIIERQPDHWLSSIYAKLKIVLKVHQGDIAQKELIVNSPLRAPEEHHSLETLFIVLCLYWVDAVKGKKRLPKLLERLYEQALKAGYSWLAMETAELLFRIKGRSSYNRQSAVLREASGIKSIVDVFRPIQTWELSLKALINLNQQLLVTNHIQKELRLAWFINLYDGEWILQPREQKINVKGEWGKGRVIAIKRLSTNIDEFDYLTPQDIRICKCINSSVVYDEDRYHGQAEYKFNAKALSALIGHPLVFWEDTPSSSPTQDCRVGRAGGAGGEEQQGEKELLSNNTFASPASRASPASPADHNAKLPWQTTRVEIVRGEPELLVTKRNANHLSLELNPKLPQSQNILAILETPTRIKVIEFNAQHQRIAEILGKENRLDVPASASEQVLAAINAVCGIVTVHSDIGGGLVGVEEVPSIAIPHIQLLPALTGLKVAILSRPFAQGGSYYRPGIGGETVIAEIDGKRLQTKRNLSDEKQLASSAIAACPTLARSEQQALDEWLIEQPQDCLELLVELQALGDTVVVEWPQGEKLRIKRQVSFEDLQLTIQRQQDWFAASGELKVDKNLVLSMQQLLELLEKSPSRFIQIGDGEFLALSETFRKRLDELRTFSQKHNSSIRFHPLAALGLEDFVDSVGELKADEHWKAHIERLKQVRSSKPELPSTLQATLRDYQIEGFNWLARLANWGVGACLADQMGLGKTLEALAVILLRAHEGPTLVIAPTSVCMNWVDETQRFAPTLNIVQFGDRERQKLVDELQAFDMLICSYGLMQLQVVSQILSSVQWQTIVLDEAQAIKNMNTKRSQAAMNLKGGFKLITTGTPIENNLGELWNLFRFINPGLLGSFESFNQRFATPIEKYKDNSASSKLKKLIQPFVLRRTKDQVLQELPSRTEIVLHVELSQQEMAFYEALRQQAISKLAQSEASAGQKHLQVLAEIMRLRRACCNPSLVMPEAKLSSSKLQLFAEVLASLLANRHKALVFSQFVDHLHIIRDYLDEQGISYQYLDGSTPAPERKKRVDAFQAGSADVFLISLKAGGTGLNLTAADYVIHMDPWWNPAVEDQASDRAHRIGQQRPVTIYRLVVKDTIEQKIVELHQHKRDLADSLLEGADISGKISTEELLQLLSEN